MTVALAVESMPGLTFDESGWLVTAVAIAASALVVPVRYPESVVTVPAKTQSESENNALSGNRRLP
jgi:hypothetical protein